MYEVNLFFFSGLDDDLKWSARKLLKKKKKAKPPPPSQQQQKTRN